MRDPDVWLCHQCNDCTTRTVREAPVPVTCSPPFVRLPTRHFAFPSFMGKALATPKALPWLLLLVPLILLMTACIALFAPQAADGSFVFHESRTVDFNLFLPHSVG